MTEEQAQKKVHKFTWRSESGKMSGLACGGFVHGSTFELHWRYVTCKRCLKRKEAK